MRKYEHKSVEACKVFSFGYLNSKKKVSRGFPKSAVVLEGQVRDLEDFHTPQIFLRLLEKLYYLPIVTGKKLEMYIIALS